MVLCPDDLPEGLPGCEEVAKALDEEIEEFSMFALPGPSPSELAPQEVAGPGVPFVVWTTSHENTLTLHVYEAENAVEVSKTLDLAAMDELPTAYDLGILYKNLMGTSLYSELAELEESELVDLAVPEEKEAIILDRAALGKGKAELPPEFKHWFPQFTMGWALLSYPGTHNAGREISDVYNGLQLSLRFPIPRGIWAGVSILIAQSLEKTFNYQNPPQCDFTPDPDPSGMNTAGSYSCIREGKKATFIDKQIVITADGAWHPYMGERVGVWLAISPGITRTSIQLIHVGECPDDVPPDLCKQGQKVSAWRMSLAGSIGFQVMIVPRVTLETGLRLGYTFPVYGPERYFLDPLGEKEYGHLYYKSGTFQMAYWISMVFG